jgi:uncharacterized protein (DUF1778 family)
LHIVRTIRVTLLEFNAINDAAAALKSQRATLIQEGVIEAAHKLGLFSVDLPIRPRRAKWTDVPERGDESATERFAVSYSPTTYDLLQRAAKLTEVSESLFAVGATLRYIANLKRSQSDNPKLKAVQLPPKFS